MGEVCQCSCGKTKFTVTGEPLLRIICHCTVCQQFNDAEYADVAMVLTENVQIDADAEIDYQQYKKPPAVNRGKCKACNQPAIENIKMPLSPSMTIIPSANFPGGEPSIKPSMHVFYHRRIRDAHDDLPKHAGFIRSQLALTLKMFLLMIRGNKKT